MGENIKKRILHISHNDADGMMPCTILKSALEMDAIRLNSEDEYCMEIYNIDPAGLYSILEMKITSNFDYFIITDLYMPLIAIELLSKRIPIDHVLICDHHQVEYDMNDIYELYHADSKEQKDVVNKHIIIRSEFNNVQTCATTLFTSLGIFALTEIFNTELIREAMKNVNKDTDNMFTDFYKICGYFRKLLYLAEITRLRDTFDFVNNLADKKSIDSDYLYLTSRVLNTNEFISFICSYLNDPWFIGEDLFQPEQEGTNYYLSKNSYLSQRIEALICERSDAIDYAMKTMQTTMFFEKINGYQERVKRICACIIKEDKSYSSEISYHILEKRPDVDIVIIYNILESTIQLRSRKDSEIDCSVIARHLGGGGHKAAAGYAIDKYDQSTLFKEIFSKLLTIEAPIFNRA